MIHPLAIVQTPSIGPNTQVWQFAIIWPGARIGDHCNINCHTAIEDDVIIGDHVTLKAGVYLGNGTRVGDRVFIGPNACFVNDRHPRSKRHLSEHRITRLEDGCSIGAGAVIMDGIRVGRHALVAAGSVVTRDVPDFALVGGNPARRVGWVDEAGARLVLEGDRWINTAGDAFAVVNGELVKQSR